MGIIDSLQKSIFSHKLYLTLASIVLFFATLNNVQAGTNTLVRDLRISRDYGLSAQYFDQQVDLTDLQKGVGNFLKQTLSHCVTYSTNKGKSPQSIAAMSGRWLEYAVLLALRERSITPVYWQVEFSTVPGNFDDIVVWSKQYGPIILSCKTSLRERYKQADLEAVALQIHYPNAKFFLITLDNDKGHVARIRQKIHKGKLMALQEIYDETNVDELFTILQSLEIIEPGSGTLRSGKLVPKK